MKPVFQAVIHPERGDCFAACVASILELTLAEVPNFRAQHRNMIIPIQTWLRGRGLCYFELDKWAGRATWPYLADGLHCLLTVPSQSFPGTQHCVVGRWSRDAQSGAVGAAIVHDPNPRNREYSASTADRVGFLLAIHP
jgi:hypothetical protein